MSQKIRRGGKGVRKTAAAQGKARQVKAARVRTGSAMDAVMGWLPFSEAQLHRLFLAAILGGAVVLAWMVASFAGLPAMAQQQLAAISHDAGFEVRRVNVSGTKNLNELKVYQLALADNHRAMPLVDIDALRGRLLALSWVEDARVSRQLPDTLAIDIIERKPVAVLRKPDRLVLIDATGHELQAVSEARAKGRLVIAGPGAGQQVEALNALLGAAPAMKPQVAEAEWIGNRRWNLTFKTGQVLALPEGEPQSAKALMTFARLDGVNRLLGGKALAFDMRAPDRIYFRLAGRTDTVEKPAISTKTADAADAPKPKGEASAKPAAVTKGEQN
jgi:cell division protein FtsQ